MHLAVFKKIIKLLEFLSTTAVKVTVRSAMKSDAYCRTQCRTLYNCPAPDPITCQMCIRKACGKK